MPNSVLPWLSFGLALLSAVLIPLIIVLLRTAVRWSRVEARLDSVIQEVRQLIEDKEKVHTAIFESMRDDRKATDRRLRWLEENIWNRKGGTGA